MSKEYTDYLESKDWRRLKAAAFARYGRRCQCCSSKHKLHGHHLIYRVPLKAGRVEDIMPLCETCHRIVHETPEINTGYRIPELPEQRRQYIILAFRHRYEPPKPVQRPKPRPRLVFVPAPKRVRALPDIEAQRKLDANRQAQANCARINLVRRAAEVLHLPEYEAELMSDKALKRRIKAVRKEKQRVAFEGTQNLIVQMREQAAANPGCTHFVFKV